MNQVAQVYHWAREIDERMELGAWQAKGAALFSLGIVWSEHNWTSKVAERLGWFGQLTSMERRLQRWLDNERIDVAANCQAWSRWVFDSLVDSKQVVLLVDLTKVGHRMDILMVGLAYRKRCIPLAWHCMTGNEPWSENQVDIILRLLGLIAPVVPTGCIPLVQADRGIGNSSRLLRGIAAMGWHYLVRVKGAAVMRQTTGEEAPLQSLIEGRSHWSGKGHIFKSKGWLPVYVHLLWRGRMKEPWCLVTNAAWVDGSVYATRMWQEEAFRDLKSGGWQWQRSHIKHPDHADRLLLAMTLAYGWVIALGTYAIRAGAVVRHRLSHGKRRSYSVFRLGLRYFRDQHAQGALLPSTLFFRPNLNHF